MYLYNCLSIADRGITGSSSIYQSVYIYDLRTKRYERKVPGVYIIPSQAHEFKLLNDELLMGLSENRNQIYIWNLNTGTYLHVSVLYGTTWYVSACGECTHTIRNFLEFPI